MEDPGLRGLVEECLEEKNKLKQLSHLKRVAQYMKKSSCAASDMEHAVQVLVKMFKTVEPKSAHRRTISSILQSLPDGLQGVSVHTLSDQLASELQASTDDLSSLRRKIEFISAHLENFPMGEMVIGANILQVLDFFHCCLGTISQAARQSTHLLERSSAMDHCLACLKTIMTVIQKCSGTALVDETDASASLEGLLKTSWDILAEGTFSLDCVSAAGLAMALIKKSLVGEEEGLKQVFHNPKNRLSVIQVKGRSSFKGATLTRTLIGCGRDRADPSLLGNRIISNSSAAQPRCRLFLLHGILAMYTPSILTQRMSVDGQEEKCFLTDVAFWELMSLNSVLTSASLSLCVSSAILQWLTVGKASVYSQEYLRKSLDGSGKISKEIFGYIWQNWNHTVDGIRYKCRSIFEGMLEIHIICKKGDSGGEDPFLFDILQRLITYSWHIRSKYGLLVSLVTHFRVERILVLHPNIVNDLMMAMSEQSIAPYGGELLAKLYQQHLTELGADTDTWYKTWIRPALGIMQGRTGGKQQVRYLNQYFLPGVLKFNPSCLQYVVSQIDSATLTEAHDSRRLSMIIMWLKVARTVGVLKNNVMRSEQLEYDQHLWKGFVSLTVLQQALCHRDSQLSADTLSLICDSNRTTEEVTSDELDLLQSSLPLHMASHLAAARQQRVTATKKMLFRIRESSKSYEKKLVKASGKGDHLEMERWQTKLEEYKTFLEWLWGLLVRGLAPGCNYPRRATSLLMMTTMRMLFKGEHSPVLDYESLWDSRSAPFLLHQLNDTFDSNKVMAFDLLKDVKQDCLGWQNPDDLSKMYDCALQLASSHKPHHCETAAYLLRVLANQDRPLLVEGSGHEDNVFRILEDLCQALTEQINRGCLSLLEAAMSGPMYGVLHCIREILRDVKPREVADQPKRVTLFQHIVSLCHGVAEVASPTVCTSSPEGYLPESKNESTDMHGDTDTVPRSSSLEVFHVTPQMVLVCCWRSMKEVSLTLSHLAMTLPLQGEDHYILSCSEIEDMGNLFLQLLRESKHRGAFELAYAGFEKLCATLWRSSNPSLASFPKLWLHQLLLEVTDGTDALCATRRSAGLPFAIQAIVGTEPDVMGRANFKYTMSELIQVLEEDNSEKSVKKVHAMNVLRTLYRDSRLGEEVFPFLAEGVQAAIRGFASHQWAVRNSSTLLFSALVTRIFGVNREKDEMSKKNCMAVREFFSRFPSLLPFLTEQLETSIHSSNDGEGLLHPSLFPVLIILSHLHPSYQEGDTSQATSVLVPLIIRCAQCPVYKTRCMAARAIQALVPLNDVNSVLVSLVQSLPSTAMDEVNQNHVHGTLLMVSGLIDGHIRKLGTTSRVTQQFLTEVVPLLHSCLWLASSNNRCPTTRVTFIQILTKAIIDEAWIESSAVPPDTALSLASFQKELITMVLSEIDQSPSSIQPDYVNLALEQAAAITTCLHGSVRQSTKQSQSGTTADRLSKPFNVDGTKFSQADLLIKLLRSPFYEVRSQVLIFLMTEGSDFVQVKEESIYRDNDQTLGRKRNDEHDPILLELVIMATGKEGNLECLEKALQILFYCYPLSAVTTVLKESHSVSPEQFVSQLLNLAKSHQVRSDLCASVIALSAKLLQNMKGDSFADLLSEWIPLVELLLTDDTSPDIQLTVSTALCDMLTAVTRQQETVPAHLYIHLWNLLLRLQLLYENPSLQNAVKCISDIATITGYTLPGVYSPTMHCNQAILVTVGLFTQVVMETDPAACLSQLCLWASGSIPDVDEQNSTDNTAEQSETTKLFERGESSLTMEDSSVVTAALTSIDSIRENHDPSPQLASAESGSCTIFHLKTDKLCHRSLSEATEKLYDQYSGQLEASIKQQPLLTAEFAFLETDQFEASWAILNRHLACVESLINLYKGLRADLSKFDLERTNRLQMSAETALAKFVARL